MLSSLWFTASQAKTREKQLPLIFCLVGARVLCYVLLWENASVIRQLESSFFFSLRPVLALFCMLFTADLPRIAKCSWWIELLWWPTELRYPSHVKARLCSLIRIASLLIRDTPKANSKLTLTKSWIVFPSKTIRMIAACRVWFRRWVFVLKMHLRSDEFLSCLE